MDEFKVEDLEKMEIKFTKETLTTGPLGEEKTYYVESFSGFITFDELRALPTFKRKGSFEHFANNVHIFCTSDDGKTLKILQPPQLRIKDIRVPNTKQTIALSLSPDTKLLGNEYERVYYWLRFFKAKLETLLDKKTDTVTMK